MMKEGHSKKKAFKKVQTDIGCSESTIQATYKQKDYWLEWGRQQDREPSAKPGTDKRRGQRGSRQERGNTTSKGCRRPAKRGYLGRKQHLRETYLKVAAWAEREQEQGHTHTHTHTLGLRLATAV